MLAVDGLVKQRSTVPRGAALVENLRVVVPQARRLHQLISSRCFRRRWLQHVWALLPACQDDHRRPQHGGRAHALRWQASQALDLLDLALLRVVLAVSPALLAPSGSVSGAVVLRLVQPDRVRKREITSSSR